MGYVSRSHLGPSLGVNRVLSVSDSWRRFFTSQDPCPSPFCKSPRRGGPRTDLPLASSLDRRNVGIRSSGIWSTCPSQRVSAVGNELIVYITVHWWKRDYWHGRTNWHLVRLSKREDKIHWGVYPVWSIDTKSRCCRAARSIPYIDCDFDDRREFFCV